MPLVQSELVASQDNCHVLSSTRDASLRSTHWEILILSSKWELSQVLSVIMRMMFEVPRASSRERLHVINNAQQLKCINRVCLDLKRTLGESQQKGKCS